MGKTWAVNTVQARVMTPRRLDRITMSRTDDRINKTNCSRSASEALLWRQIRVASVGATVAGITVLGSLMLTSQQVASAATPLSAAVLPVAVGSDNPPAPTASMPADMPGMDMSGSSPAPTEAPMPQDMPGMDMSGSSGGASVHRPLAPVLGTFGGGSAAVLLTAGMMRRKDRAAGLAKKAARAADRSGK